MVVIWGRRPRSDEQPEGVNMDTIITLALTAAAWRFICVISSR